MEQKQKLTYSPYRLIMVILILLITSCSPEELISVETEIELGEMMVNSMKESGQLPPVKDAEIQSAIDTISQRLLSHIQEKKFNYRISVVENDQVNAFTMPGGNIFIFTGLIKQSDSPEEVAAVIGHEIGHAEERHVTGKIVKQLGINLVILAVTGGDVGILTELVGTLVSTAFDREQEKEADKYSLELLEKSGIPPSSLITFFQKMKKLEEGIPEELSLVLTHPTSDKRIQAAKKYEVSHGFHPKPFKLDWDRIRKKI